MGKELLLGKYYKDERGRLTVPNEHIHGYTGEGTFHPVDIRDTHFIILTAREPDLASPLPPPTDIADEVIVGEYNEIIRLARKPEKVGSA